jgi:hypothetical protein
MNSRKGAARLVNRLRRNPARPDRGAAEVGAIGIHAQGKMVPPGTLVALRSVVPGDFATNSGSDPWVALV